MDGKSGVFRRKDTDELVALLDGKQIGLLAAELSHNEDAMRWWMREVVRILKERATPDQFIDFSKSLF